MSVCISCITHANMCTQSLCLRANRSALSVLPHVPRAYSALPKLPCSTNWLNKENCLVSLGLVLEEPKVGSCDAHKQQSPVLLRAGFASKHGCGVGVSELI